MNYIKNFEIECPEFSREFSTDFFFCVNFAKKFEFNINQTVSLLKTHLPHQNFDVGRGGYHIWIYDKINKKRVAIIYFD